MNEGSGTTVTDATGTNNGTATDTTRVAGKHGQALSFNGTSSWVTIPHHPSLAMTNALTLSAWVKPTTVDNWRTVIAKDFTLFDESSYGLWASNGTGPAGGIFTERDYGRPAGTTRLPLNTWSHLAVTYDGTTARLFLNGTQLAQYALAGTIMEDGGAVHIGGNTSYGDYFQGAIDDVRIYNRAQTAAEITTDMNSPLGGTTVSTSAVRANATAVTTSGPSSGEVCTPKTAPVSFTTPGTPPPDPEEEVRQVTLSKDNFVIKTVKTDPAACDGGPCTVIDSSTMHIGGTGTDKTATVVGFRLDELPDGAGVVNAVLKLGTSACASGTCPADTLITATPLKSSVTAETKGSELAGDADRTVTPCSLPINSMQADIAGSEGKWLLFTSNKDEVITIAEPSAAEQPSLALTYLPAGPPSKVLNLRAYGGDASATASWGLPESNGSVAFLDGYDVQVVDQSGATVKTLEVKDPWAPISGLTNDVTYTIKVRAKTAYGVSEWESTSATTKAVHRHHQRRVSSKRRAPQQRQLRPLSRSQGQRYTSSRSGTISRLRMQFSKGAHKPSGMRPVSLRMLIIPPSSPSLITSCCKTSSPWTRRASHSRTPPLT
ncbi:LamG-like jellyroll fold domain-containing protein [Nonomuraea sp. SYSU D8015]|uniref:LamG-like jellyroll fold domain-containing protein n=1 Tax=Nonomuraea sp. SYSU D8015 TaxID=2593644 RepID=UPI0016608803|nr:LamG-like jellyroll fold domain-containing protein [Nonomuraea sp. SYSU D8015]